MKKTDHIIDVRDPDQMLNMMIWCEKNLNKNEYERILMGMFPLWYRFKFHCPKNKIWAVLSH